MKTPFQVGQQVWRTLNGSLRARLVLPTVVMATASAGLMVLTAAQLHNGDLRQANADRAAIFASLATAAAVAHMSTYQHADTSELLQALRSHRPDVEALSIIGPDGLVTATSDAALRGQRPWSTSQLEQRESLPLRGREGFVVVRPIVNEASCRGCHHETGPIAWLELRFSNASLLAAQSRLTTSLAVAALPSLLLLLAVTWWLLGREAVHPIQRLVDAMRRAEAGGEGLADEGRPDEIGVAARKFDSTLAALHRSRAELDRVHAQHMERADRFAMVGQMATGLAHEIKNPLAGLSGALELLAEDLAHEPKQSEVVSEMRHQVDRLTGIMDGLLHFARPPLARLAPTDVNTRLEKVLFLLGQQRNRARVKIRRELGEGLPPVFADPSQLEQVFLNIGLNASQALGEAGGEIAVRTRLEGAQVVVEIADSGPGIPEAVRPNIFTPFFTTRSNGTGLGLALSMRFISEHGGRLWFSCPPEGGTVFSISLPLAAQTADVAGSRRAG